MDSREKRKLKTSDTDRLETVKLNMAHSLRFSSASHLHPEVAIQPPSSHIFSVHAMAEEIAYADLNIQQTPAFSRLPCSCEHLCQNSNIQQPPQWYRVALMVACTVILLLVGALITLAVRVLQTKETPCGSRCLPNDSDFRLQLRHFACNLAENSTAENATDCKICPKSWRFYRDNCYWISEGKKNWSQSQDDCRAKNSTLLGIRDKEEMAFIKKSIMTGKHQYPQQEGKHLWLGLIAKHSEQRRWEWVDGASSPVEDSELFSKLGPAKENKCGQMNENEVYSEPCDEVSQWMCKKVAFSA